MGWSGAGDLLEGRQRGRDGTTFPHSRSIYMSGIRALGSTVGGTSAKTGRGNTHVGPASFSPLGEPRFQPRACRKGEESAPTA